jgi:hypothetical protein
MPMPESESPPLIKQTARSLRNAGFLYSAKQINHFSIKNARFSIDFIGSF